MDVLQPDQVIVEIGEDQEDERLWEEAVVRSEPKLSKLADKIRADIAAGRTKPLDPDEL